MKTRVTSSQVPSGSAINARLPGAYFHDCYTVSVPASTRTALRLFLTALARTPPWVDFLMGLRNRIVKLVGMKDVGRLGDVDLSKPDSAYLPGDRVGIFTLVSTTPDEVLLGVHERHFDVVLSVYKHPSCEDGQQSIAQTTVVHVNNRVGRLYMIPITPMHKLVAQAVLSRIA